MRKDFAIDERYTIIVKLDAERVFGFLYDLLPRLQNKIYNNVVQ